MSGIGFCPAQDSPDYTDYIDFFFVIIKRLAKMDICYMLTFANLFKSYKMTKK